MTSPMEVLQDTPKVWLVWYCSKYYDTSPYIDVVFTSEASAMAYVNTKLEDERRYYQINWEELHD